MFMRHGKSDWGTGSVDDHARPLNNRGEASARRMGVVLRELGLIPDLVVSSSAVRARSTAELARLSGGWESRLIIEDALYGASVAESLAVAAHHGGSAGRIMLVGHQPTWGMAVAHLTGSLADMRTATVADIEVRASAWDELPQAQGVLVSLLQARDFLDDGQ